MSDFGFDTLRTTLHHNILRHISTNNPLVDTLVGAALVGAATCAVRAVPELGQNAWDALLRTRGGMPGASVVVPRAARTFGRQKANAPFSRVLRYLRSHGAAASADRVMVHTIDETSPPADWFINAPGSIDSIVFEGHRVAVGVQERKDAAASGGSRPKNPGDSGTTATTTEEPDLLELELSVDGGVPNGQALLQRLVVAADAWCTAYDADEAYKCRVYACADPWNDPHWRITTVHTIPRSCAAVALREGQMDRILAAWDFFQGNRTFYQDQALPYKLGILLHGPPGTGKSSLLQALAWRSKMCIAYLSLTAIGSDNDLGTIFTELPKGCIVVMEDVDVPGSPALARTPGDLASSAAAREERPGVTLSGLLNVLDGPLYREGTVFVITTNRPEALDPAVVRRCEINEALGLCTSAQARCIVARLCDIPPDSPALAGVAAAVGDGILSPALVSQVALAHRTDAAAVLARLAECRTTVPPPERKRKRGGEPAPDGHLLRCFKPDPKPPAPAVAAARRARAGRLVYRA